MILDIPFNGLTEGKLLSFYSNDNMHMIILGTIDQTEENLLGLHVLVIGPSNSSDMPLKLTIHT